MDEDSEVFISKIALERLIKMGMMNQEQDKEKVREQAVTTMADMLGKFNQQLKKAKVDAPLRRALVIGLQQHLLK